MPLLHVQHVPVGVRQGLPRMCCYVCCYAIWFMFLYICISLYLSLSIYTYIYIYTCTYVVLTFIVYKHNASSHGFEDANLPKGDFLFYQLH